MLDTMFVREDIREVIGDKDPFSYFAQLDGEVFRALESRRTFAVELSGKKYFVKFHRGTTWKEVFKNLLQLRLPVVSARNEWRALTRLQDLGIKVPVIAAYGRRGLLPTTCESFIVTEDIGTQQNLEDLTRDWSACRPDFGEKLALIREVAQVSRKMHEHGICHRDLYICHFMLKGMLGNRLTLIDLHRALIKARLPRRWIVKDVGSLYFSAMDIGLTRRDLLRFIRWYANAPLKRALGSQGDFWRQVERRARQLKARHG